MYSETMRNDEKVRYLIKTLSRTKRKDYENYVVNAIWNRISKKVRPVSQQYVSNPHDERRHYFIDLYFPLINLGVECDELHHIANYVDDIERENVIEFTIKHELSKVMLNDNYDVCRVKIYKEMETNDGEKTYRMLSYEELESQIDDAVKKINYRLEEITDEEIEHDWNILWPAEYFKDKTKIKTSENIIFKTQKEINSILFNTDYALQKGGYRLPTFEGNLQFDNHIVWYPQLVIRKPNGEKLARTEWYNQLIGSAVIEEYHATRVDEHSPDEKKIVFAKDKDYLGNDGYKFVGIFALDGSRRENEHVTWVYKKISDECSIIR